MSVNVYWTCLENEFDKAVEPDPVIGRLFQTKKPDRNNPMNNTMYCPSVGNALGNMYALRSLYEYEFTIVNDTVATNYYDYEFFSNHVIIRDIEQKFFSFQQKYLFFTDEDSLEMLAYLSPFVEDNEVARRTFSIPGQFDIGKWFRNLEFNFYLKDDYDTFHIDEGDAYTYVKFNTKEKIKFHKFYPSDKIWQFVYRVADLRNSPREGRLGLPDYYDMLKFKQDIIEEIKKNLVQ